ncbi:MAG TPA: ABC transporter substrate-binding protein [Alphaproteobacteria bacterium]|nr:ABC transporter substrate-binding protein [Alphaproteobacteria bacterium]
MPMPVVRTRVFPGPQNLGLFAAEALGLFERHGVSAEIHITSGSDEQRTTLASGASQVIHSAVDNAVYMKDVAGLDVVIVSGGSNGMNHLVVRPGIGSYEDIRGKTVIVDAAFTAYAFQLYTMLALKGLNKGDYKVLPKGGATQRLQAMRESPDHVAAMLNPPWNFVALGEGYRSFGSAVGTIGAYQGDGTFALRAWAEANADALAGYLAAYIAGTRWARDPAHRPEATLLLAERLKIDRAIAAQSVEAAVGREGGLAVDARFDFEGFRNMLRIRESVAGTWDGRVPETERFLDLSYYQQALARLQDSAGGKP